MEIIERTIFFALKQMFEAPAAGSGGGGIFLGVVKCDYLPSCRAKDEKIDTAPASEAGI